MRSANPLPMTNPGLTLSPLPQAGPDGQFGLAVPSAPESTDQSLLADVCSSLEAAGLCVVVVVAVDGAAGPASLPLAKAQQSLQGTGLSVVAEASAVLDNARRAGATQPNLKLMRTGTDALDLSASGSDPHVAPNAAPVVVMTTASNQDAARAALAARGLGYMVTSAQPPTGAAPGGYLAAHPSYGGHSPAVPRGALEYNLTPREVEVLQHFANGALTNQVAKHLYVSPKTIKNHLAHIYAKLGVATRTQAISIALKKGIVSIQ